MLYEVITALVQVAIIAICLTCGNSLNVSTPLSVAAGEPDNALTLSMCTHTGHDEV